MSTIKTQIGRRAFIRNSSLAGGGLILGFSWFNSCRPKDAETMAVKEMPKEWFEINGKGRLVTYSRLEFAPVGFQDDVPYCIALLDYGDFKVFGRIDAGLEEDAIKVGMEMVTASSALPNGQLNYVFKKA